MLTCMPKNINPQGCGVYNNKVTYKTILGECIYYEKGSKGKHYYIDKKNCNC